MEILWQSIFSEFYYVLNTKDFLSVVCYDWSDNFKKFGDNLRVSLRTEEFQDWINNKAYNNSNRGVLLLGAPNPSNSTQLTIM